MAAIRIVDIKMGLCCQTMYLNVCLCYFGVRSITLLMNVSATMFEFQINEWTLHNHYKMIFYSSYIKGRLVAQVKAYLNRKEIAIKACYGGFGKRSFDTNDWYATPLITFFDPAFTAFFSPPFLTVS